MQRNTTTEVKNLKQGDVFYKLSDKSKTVYQIVPGEVKRTDYQTYSIWAMQRQGVHPDAFKGNTMIVFLRHSDTSINPTVEAVWNT